MTSNTTYTMTSEPVTIPIDFGSASEARVAYSPKDQNLYVTTADFSEGNGAIYVYHVERTRYVPERRESQFKYTYLKTILVSHALMGVFCNPNRSIAYVRLSEGWLTLDTSSNEIISRPAAENTHNASVGFAPDGSLSYWWAVPPARLGSPASPPEFISIDEDTGTPAPNSAAKIDMNADCIAVSPDGRWGYYARINTGGSQVPVYLLDLHASPVCAKGPINKSDASIQNFDMAHNNQLLIATGTDIARIDVATNTPLGNVSLQGHDPKPITYHPNPISCSRVSDRAAMVVSAWGGISGVLYLDTTKLAPNVSLPPLILNGTGAGYLGFDSYGNLYVPDPKGKEPGLTAIPVAYLEKTLADPGRPAAAWYGG